LLAVDRGRRGLGIGEALLEALTAHARALSIPALVLSSQPSMTAAHALYTKAGYARAPERDWTRSDRSFWVFEKRVT
jgi:ribosomal protein S18 acetylase RimI-like enzyme